MIDERDVSMGEVIRIDEARIKDHLGVLVAERNEPNYLAGLINRSD